MRTPLHLAAAEGQLEIVQLLIKQGVRAVTDRGGGYGYFDAKTDNHEEIIKK